MKDQIEEARQRVIRMVEKENENSGYSTQTLNHALDTFTEILEELQVAEEELRQQNEELLETHETVEKERARYRELFEFAPDAYLVTDEKGIIQEANQAASLLFNLDNIFLTGKPILALVEPADSQLFNRILKNPGQVGEIELRIRQHGGKKMFVSVLTNKISTEGQQEAQIRWMLRDISERRQALLALDASERRFRTLFDQANLGIALLDLKGRFVHTNPALQEMLGRRDEELAGMDFARLAHPEDRKAVTQAVLAVDAERRPLSYIKTRLKRANEKFLWGSVALSPLRDEQNKTHLIVMLIDNITAQRQAEDELVEMRRRLLDSGESERLRLAQELHDGPMQDLYGAVFHLTNLPHLDGNADALEQIKDVQEILRRVAGTLRSICGELRPPTLTNLGLERAIRSHAERIQEYHPEMKLDLQLTQDGQALPGHIRLAFYRIYQQCMTNILRHAQASQVVISFHFDDDEAVLDIWDNGKGFTLPEKWVDLLREGHFGLAGIAERVEAMRGTLKIDTKPGAGTLVHVAVPKEEK